jgi:hypothetical protein
VKKSDTIVAEVHAIRALIDQNTMDMTSAEITAYFHESGRRLSEKYGFKIYKSAAEAERERVTVGIM